MLTKISALIVLALGITTAGVVFARQQTAKSCCEVGADCCYPGSPCCTDCCAEGADCCFEGSACCGTTSTTPVVATPTATEDAAKPKCCKTAAVCCPTKHCCVAGE